MNRFAMIEPVNSVSATSGAVSKTRMSARPDNGLWS